MKPRSRPAATPRSTVLGTALLLLVATSFFAPFALAQTSEEGESPAALSVDRLEVCREVVERQPVGVASSFPEDVGSIACYTELSARMAPTVVDHVWLREGQEAARVRLSVGGERWRTWSTKRIPPEWAGAWSCVVETREGDELARADFVVAGEGAESGAGEGAGDEGASDEAGEG